jgi:hypothetical protein
VRDDTYSSAEDLLLTVALPAGFDKTKYVADAANEIDSTIGFTYQVPIDISDTSKVVKPAILLLQRINNFIATGRILMAVTSAEENAQVHAYARRLLDEAQAALVMIRDGQLVIEGAVLVNDGETSHNTGPRQFNQDKYSRVDGAYNRFLMPGDQELAPDSELPPSLRRWGGYGYGGYAGDGYGGYGGYR